jgi:hypothetical protein
VCVSFEIPDTLEYRAAVVDSVNALTKWINWQKGGIGKGDTRAAQVGALMKKTAWKTLCIGDNMACGTDLSALEDCLCEIASLLQQQRNDDVAQDRPVIPPDDPAQNLPGLAPPATDLPAQQRLDAALCDVSKIQVEWIFESIYQGQLEKCAQEDNDPNWGAIFTSTGGLLFGAIALASGGTAALALGATGAAFTAAGLGDFIFDYNILPDNDCSDLQRVPVALSRIYGCQLWEHIRENGLSYSTVQRAFECTNQVAITYYRLNIEDDEAAAVTADDATRELLTQFVRNGEFYQSFMIALDLYAENPYSPRNVCEDCATCDSATEDTIRAWDDPRIVAINPAPAVIDNATYAWPAETLVEVTLDDVYCLQRVNVELVRGATDTSPTSVTVKIGDVEFSDSTGGFGSGTLDIGTAGTPTKSFTLQSDASANDMILGLDKKTSNGLIIRSVASYADCS